MGPNLNSLRAVFYQKTPKDSAAAVSMNLTSSKKMLRRHVPVSRMLWTERNASMTSLLPKILKWRELSKTVLRPLLVDLVKECIERSKLVIVMGSYTYGEKTTNAAISTYDEMKFIVQRKDFFLIKMCDSFKHAVTIGHFPDDTVDYKWTPGEPLDDKLVD